MNRIHLLIFLIIFSFLSCETKQKKEGSPKENSFSPPVIIKASKPAVTFIDTCPKPNIIILPAKGSKLYTIQTQNGPQPFQFPAPDERPILAGEAGGYTFMQNFNTEQGLAQSTINCGYKDRTGNLWFGTSGGGVSKYDGSAFTTFRAAQGLSNNIVRCIMEDKNGNLWFGTNGGGVSKYDGKSFSNFTTDQGLLSNRVFSIIEDNSGNLWFCTVSGISKYTPTEEKETDEKSPAGKRARFTSITKAQGLISNDVGVSIKDKKGNLWFGTSAGLSRYDGNSFTNFPAGQGLIQNGITSIMEDRKGNIWFGTIGEGAFKCSPDIKACTINNSTARRQAGISNFNHLQGLPQDMVLSITEDKSGNIWFGTGAGISRYNPSLDDRTNSLDNRTNVSLFTNFASAQGLANNGISCITEDAAGSLWIGGSQGGGLCKYDGKSFTSFATDQGLIYNKVWNIIEDRKENLWFATAGGISRYNRHEAENRGQPSGGGGFTNFNLKTITSQVRCVAEDKNGNIWFGSSLGAIKYDGKSFTNYTMTQGLPHNAVLSITEDKKGNLWFGTYGGGVSRFDGKSFTNYSKAQGLADNTIKCIIQDKSGNMWFGTNGNGISKFDGISFTNYSRAQGLPNNIILSIAEDKTGALWLGTSGGGVCRYKPSPKDSIISKPFTTLTSARGLADDMVYAIAEDTLNNIMWFGTNFGLSGLKLNSISSGTDGAEFENFNNNNGYALKDINTGSLFLDKKGIIWAGTSDKLVRFDYKAVHKSTAPPALFIQSLKIQGENVSWYSLIPKESNNTAINESDSLAVLNEEMISNGHPLTEAQCDAMRKKFGDIKFDGISRFCPLPKNLVLPFAHNNIAFDFLAVETARPSMIRYQYMLEGYDHGWSPVTDKTAAVFGNIYEGTYTFKLKAKSPDGVWSTPVTFTFKVLPPWYRTWWMYLTYLFLVLSAIALFFRWRTASLRKEKEILEQTVIERTKEVVEQKEVIEEKQKEIVDSINYAKRIQYTLLADENLLKQNLNEHFVLFQPKDIVSGDFYWAAKIKGDSRLTDGSNEKTEHFYLAVCDSTGHGVPGAFMSLLNISFLNEAITEKHIQQPNEILNYVRNRLIESVSQDGAQDGMDGILVCIEKKAFASSHSSLVKPSDTNEQVTITYAAANNAPVIVRDNAVIILPSDKMPIGKGEKGVSFTLHTIDAKKGDVLFFYTDGYADQFGGPKGKKFKYKQLENLLISINLKSMEDQKQLLTAAIAGWKGNLEQVDDILVIGMRI